MCCESISVEKEYIVACVEYKQINGSLLITIKPYLRVANHLLCNVEISCTSKDGEVERKKIGAGETAKLIAVSSQKEPQLSVLVKGLKFSAPIRFGDVQAGDKPVQFHLFDREKQLSLVVSMVVEGSPEEGFLATLFSRSALLDCTGLNASVAANCLQLDIVRRTYLSRTQSKSALVELSLEKGQTSAAALDSSVASFRKDFATLPTSIDTLVSDFTVESVKSKYEINHLRRGCIADSNWSRHPTVQSRNGLYISLLTSSNPTSL
jgi:hypothetical protein